jgi:hypothetical protein
MSIVHQQSTYPAYTAHYPTTPTSLAISHTYSPRPAADPTFPSKMAEHPGYQAAPQVPPLDVVFPSASTSYNHYNTQSPTTTTHPLYPQPSPTASTSYAHYNSHNASASNSQDHVPTQSTPLLNGHHDNYHHQNHPQSQAVGYDYEASTSSASFSTPDQHLCVHEWAPSDGAQGTPVTVKCDINYPASPNGSQPATPLNQGKALRIVFGTHPVQTSVQLLSTSSQLSTGQTCLLTAIAPSLSSTGLMGKTNRVNLYVQVLNEQHAIVESVQLGEFMYNMPQRGK